MTGALVFTLGPVVVELLGLQLLEAYDLEALDPYRSTRSPDFVVALADAPLRECAGLSRDTSVYTTSGSVLAMRYASWLATVDVEHRQSRAYLPNRGLFDNFLRTMAQVIPLATGMGLAMHAASLSFDGRAVALAAPSVTGKSTAAVRAMAAGADLLAEDVTIIGGFDEGRPAVFTSPLRNHCGAVAGPRSTPLARVYGLRRADVDRVVSLSAAQAMQVLRENVAVGTRQPALTLQALQCAEILLGNVGVKALECSLGGPFWVEVEQDLRIGQTDVAEVR